MQRFNLASNLPLALFPPVSVSSANSGPEINARAQAAGYVEIRTIEFDCAVWNAEVRRVGYSLLYVAIDNANDEIFDPRDLLPIPDARAIAEAVESAGHPEISNLDRDHTLWEVEAKDGGGVRVELRLSGYDGRVVSSDVEYDD